MNAVKWVLIGCRVLAVACGPILFASGCGDSTSQTGTTSNVQEEMKKLEGSKKAMEESSQAQKKKKK